MGIKKIGNLWFAVLFLIYFFTVHGFAQEFELSKIVITATKTEKGIWQVPASVNIITKDEIKDANAKGIPDLLRNFAGIKIYDTSGVGTAGRINMRGFWGGMSTHSLVLIDGVPVNRGEDKLEDWNLIPLDNIERIEVVKGASSALYGENAFAGVINIITKRGSSAPHFEIGSSLGNFGTQNYSVSAGGTRGNLNYFFNFSKKLTQGFRKYNNYDDIHADGKLRFFIDDASNAELSLGYHINNRGAYPWALTEAQLAQDRTQARPGTENDRRTGKKIDFGIAYDKDLGRISHIKTKIYLRNEDGLCFYTPTSPGKTFADTAKTEEQIEGESTYGATLQYELTPKILGLKNSFVIGTELERNDFDYKTNTAPYQVRSGVKEAYRAIRDKWGVYLQDEIEIISPIFLTAGIRYDQADYDFVNYSDTQPKKVQPFAFSPRCGIIYLYQKNSSIYVNLGRAFRTPSLGQLFTYGTSANPDLKPEEANNYEVGVRHQFGKVLAGSLSLYWMDIKNEIWYDYGEKKYKNYGSTSHKGGEIDLEANIIKGLKVFANYTYTCAKNESGSDKGLYLQYIPEHMGNFVLKYQSGFGLSAQLVLNCIGVSYLDAKNTQVLPGYNPVDLRISYKWGWYSFFLGIDNLFDEQYSVYGYISSNKKYYAPAPGRTFSGGLGIQF